MVYYGLFTVFQQKRGSYGRHGDAKHINQQEGNQQVQQLSPSCLVKIVGHALHYVKEIKVSQKV